MRKLHLVAACLAGAMAVAPAHSALYVFGDSLVDAGNVALYLNALGAPSQTNPAYGYEDGRFSNGPTYADVLSQRLFGETTTPYGFPPSAVPPLAGNIVGGNNFAWGAAQARNVAGDPIPSFADQLALFASSGKTLTASDIVLITFGGNDIKSLVATPDFTATYAAMQSGITYLAQVAGASRIIVTGQADIGAIPTTTLNGALPPNAYVSGLADIVNEDFRDIVEQADAAYAADIMFFDLLGFQRNLLQNAAANGLTNTVNRCINPTTGVGPGGVVSADPACTGYLYFDNTHPTKEAHVLIADGIQAQLAQSAVPEPATWATMLVGFGLVGLGMRRRRMVAA